MALRVFGPHLGGQEAGRWSGLLQALLAGWVMYVAVIGPLVEGLMLLTRRRRSLMLPIAVAVASLYVLSCVGWMTLAIGGRAVPIAPLFHWCIGIVIVWTSLRLFVLMRTAHRVADRDDPG